MNLLVPAALAFSLIIPAILLMYFMRPKRQERVIGSTLLWQQALQDLQASHPWQRLRITPLLLLQLLAAIIIILVLTRPAIFSNSPISGNSIIILQSSASMQATDVSPNRFEQAKATIADFINNMGTGDRISLITMSRTPQVLIAESQEKTQLMAALQRAQVTNQDADLQQALSLASSLAERRSNIQVVIIGDGHVIEPNQELVLPFPVRYMAIGTEAANISMQALSSRMIRGQLVAFAQIANYSRETKAIPIELYADSRLVGVQTVRLEPGRSGAVQWPNVPTNARFLHTRIVGDDMLATDNEAWSIVGGSQRGKVLLVTRSASNTFLETAFKLQSNIDLFKVTADKYAPNVGTYDLTIFDGIVPPNLPEGSLFFINPPNGTHLFGKTDAEIAVTRISAGLDEQNLLQSVDLKSIHVLRVSKKIQPAPWAQPVITTPETPLLVAGEFENRRVAALSFDLRNSDLPLQVAFPILIRNLTNWFLPQPVPGNGQIAAGLPVTLQTWPGADEVSIIGPDQQTTIIGPPFPVQPYAKTNQVGIYQVIQRVHGREMQGAFTINLFNASQSRLIPANSLPVARSSNINTDGENVSRQLREIWPWIAAFLLLVLCVEWWFFSRSYKARGAVQFATRSPARLQKTRQGVVSKSPVIAQLSSYSYLLQDRFKIVQKRFQKGTKRLTRSRKKGGKHGNL